MCKEKSGACAPKMEQLGTRNPAKLKRCLLFKGDVKYNGFRKFHGKSWLQWNNEHSSCRRTALLEGTQPQMAFFQMSLSTPATGAPPEHCRRFSNLAQHFWLEENLQGKQSRESEMGRFRSHRLPTTSGQLKLSGGGPVDSRLAAAS